MTNTSSLWYGRLAKILNQPGGLPSGGPPFFGGGLLLSDRDYINIQTFPQDYDFMGESVQYVCGMSVPPVMMAHIAGEIERQWFGRG